MAGLRQKIDPEFGEAGKHPSLGRLLVQDFARIDDEDGLRRAPALHEPADDGAGHVAAADECNRVHAVQCRSFVQVAAQRRRARSVSRSPGRASA